MAEKAEIEITLDLHLDKSISTLFQAAVLLLSSTPFTDYFATLVVNVFYSKVLEHLCWAERLRLSIWRGMVNVGEEVFEYSYIQPTKLEVFICSDSGHSHSI